MCGELRVVDRTGLIMALILVAASTALSPQIRAAEPALLRWIPPSEADVAGYKFYVAAGCAYPDRFDIGFRDPDSSGVASVSLELPEGGDEYHVMLTAYTASGAESAFSNVICLRATPQGTHSCAPTTDCRRPEAPTEMMLELWYVDSFLNESTRALRLGADPGLLRRLDKLEQVLGRAGVWVNADGASLRTALKSFAKLVRELRAARKRGADPIQVAAAEDATLNVLRVIVQREVTGLACGGDDRCWQRRSRLQKKIWRGDAKRAEGRKTSAAALYASTFKRASKL